MTVLAASLVTKNGKREFTSCAYMGRTPRLFFPVDIT